MITISTHTEAFDSISRLSETYETFFARLGRIRITP